MHEDLDLMQRVAEGDRTAVADLYDRFGSLVYKVARQFLPSQVEAEDAVQEVFVRLWQTADRYDPRRAKLVTWVMLIARRHLIDRIRRSAVRPGASAFEGDVASQAPDNVPDRQSLDDERSVKLRRRIAEAIAGFLARVGIDVNFLVTRSVWEAFFHDPRYAPSLLQQEMVAAGRHGRGVARSRVDRQRGLRRAGRDLARARLGSRGLPAGAAGDGRGRLRDAGGD